MTEMRRVTVSLPDDLDQTILSLRRDNRFSRCTYSELVRQILLRGIEMVREETQKDSA